MIRRLIVRWLWPEIYRKIMEPEWAAVEQLIEEGLLKDRREGEAMIRLLR